MRNKVSKEELRKDIETRPHILKKIENIVKPMIKADRKEFLEKNRKEEIIIFDIPLLFENNIENEFDFIITVSVSEQEQKLRVLRRKTMDEKLFSFIKSKQLPNDEKKRKSDYIIQTNNIKNTEAQVDQFLSKLGLTRCVK